MIQNDCTVITTGIGGGGGNNISPSAYVENSIKELSNKSHLNK